MAAVAVTLALWATGDGTVSLEIKQREREGITILDCKGRIVLGPETEQFRTHIRGLIESGKVNIILNLLQVDYIDSSGLGELVSLSKSLTRDGGKVRLLNLNKKQVELLVTTKLATIFELYDDEQHAINSFFPDRNVRTFDLLSFVREIDKEKK